MTDPDKHASLDLTAHCNRCGHVWLRRKLLAPKRCPNCQSTLWYHPDAKKLSKYRHAKGCDPETPPPISTDALPLSPMEKLLRDTLAPPISTNVLGPTPNQVEPKEE